jgi:putative membrane protein (TIGR04086 family)
MAMVCPQCAGVFEQAIHCPTCGVHLLYESRGHRAFREREAGGQWLHTPLGRVAAGVALAQGLAYGLRLLCTAGILAAEETDQPVWSTLTGLVVLQALQGLSLIIGGALAGAGQRRGLLVGTLVGLIHGALSILIQTIRGEPVTEIALYGQTILHVAFGMLGGVIGSSIWRPLPELAMPDLDGPDKLRTHGWQPFFASLRGPVMWGRVFAGIVIVTAGFLWGPALLNSVLVASQGTLRISHHLQAQLVTWEIVGLATLFGAAIAGATTPNGLKHGLFVGVGTCIVLIGNYLGSRIINQDQIILTVSSIVTLTIAGGWFGGRLFPPVRASNRRRYGSAA